MQPFSLVRPTTLAQASDLVHLAKRGAPAIRAGGIDLLDRMKEGIDTPDLLVELRRITATNDLPALHGITTGSLTGSPSDSQDAWTIGALTTLAEIGRAELDGAEALSQAAGQAATPSIRNTATLGGNLLQRPRCWYFRKRELLCLKKGGDLCLAIAGDNRYSAILGGGPSYIVHPSSLATALLALDATVTLTLTRAQAPPTAGPQAPNALTAPTRTLPLADLFADPRVDPLREHSLEPGQILVATAIPRMPGMRSAYQAVREKQSHDWPLAEAAVRMHIDADGRMRQVRVALGHVAPIPWLATEAAAILEGQTPSGPRFAEAAAAALADARPLGGNGYKVRLSRGLLREVLHRASGLPLPA